MTTAIPVILKDTAGNYVLPQSYQIKATAETLGSVRVGSGLTMSNDGILSADVSTVDQTYSSSSTSTNALSHKAIADSKFIQNTATGSNSLTINGTACTSSNSINIGNSSDSTGSYGVAVGWGAKCNYDSVAIGYNSGGTSGGNTTSIGYQAKATQAYAIQLGKGTNSESNSFYVGLSSSNNYKLLGSDGKIPDDRINTTIARASDIPTVNNATLTIQKNGTTVNTFTANASSNVTANITVPTSMSDLSDGSNYYTATQVDNAISSAVSSVYKPAGSVTFSNLPTPSSSLVSNVYDITDSFTTDSKFITSGQSYPAGTNVVCIEIPPQSLYGWRYTTGNNYFILYTKNRTPTSSDEIYNSSGVAYKRGDLITDGTITTLYLYDQLTVNSAGNIIINDMYDNQTDAINILAAPHPSNPSGVRACYYNSTDNISTSTSYKYDVLSGFVDLTNYVPTSRTVNGKALTGNVTLSASDVSAVASNTAITGATKCKITYDSKGLVTAGADLSASDIPDISATYQTKITSTNKVAASNISDLATVAISGSYTDLSNTPAVTTATGITYVGATSSASTSGTALGYGAKTTGVYGIAIGRGATSKADYAYQIGYGANNTTPYSLAIGFGSGKVYTLLDGNTGLIPDDRISTNIARTSAIPTDTGDLTNNAGFITSSALSGYATETWVENKGYITGITSSDVTTALGYTPYSDANPSGYQANIIETIKVNNTALTPSSKTVNISVPTITDTYSATSSNGMSGKAVASAISGKQDTISDLSTIRSGASAGATALQPNTAITGATKCKITYDSKGLVTSGADLSASDIPDISSTYQTKLTSGTTIKTINSTSLLGSGDISIPLPSIATTSVTGLVKPDGTTITITNDGTISAVGGGGSGNYALVIVDYTDDEDEESE